MRRKCRIWWPKSAASSESSPPHFLFGWLVSSSTCVDIVIAFTCNWPLLLRDQSALQEILSDTNGRMPVFLQVKAVFSLLGHAVAYPTSFGKMANIGTEDDNTRNWCTNGASVAPDSWDNFSVYNGSSSCGCYQLDGLVEKGLLASAEDSFWIQLVYDSREQCGRDVCWLPKLHHVHLHGQIVSQFDAHVILYDIPVYGLHHFSLSSWNITEQVKAHQKKPKWVGELDRNQPLFDVDTVIFAINCAAAAKTIMGRHLDSKRSHATFSISYQCLAFLWHVFAFSVASLSTLFYITVQLFYSLSSMGSEVGTRNISARTFCSTWTNIGIRCSQILYWPVFLQENGLRLRSCVEFAESAALLRHSMWSSLVIDILLGNLFGLSLLFNAEPVCLCLCTFACGITNDLLRSGCVWLMGVPAGFKLNNELAGVLGMISLNAIQIWSTLWIFIGFLLIFFVKGLAVLGILFGLTLPAALIKDMVTLATFHVSTLHYAMSFLYSWQIQALAALWRLFRGRKWNPLRQRLDSYEYTVKQHTVGSLLFTPLLLLLPTTSVFYIFFTILNTSITSFCILIEVAISVIHGTPYIKILLWLVRRRRFPSGIWFEILSCQSGPLECAYHDKIGSSSENLQEKDANKERSSIMVSALHSNFLSLGQIVSPHYSNVFRGVSGFFTASAYGALTGTRTSSSLGAGLPSMLPWMNIPSKEYWFLCYNSVLACMHDGT